jgi:hypothetical protein
MPKQTITITTDAAGKFQSANQIQDAVWGMTVNLKAAIVSPVGANVSGSFSLGAHPARDFSLASGQTADLGSWKVSHGTNAVVASGSTEPALPNTALTVEFSY